MTRLFSRMGAASLYAAGVLLALACSFLATAGPAAAQSATETACYNFVQGNIPWNYAGATAWSPTNVQNLCAGTPVAAEPGRCFDRVMTGGINWGGGTSWQWQNALDLCKGTGDANGTIACFQAQIAAGNTWQTAIPACNGSGGGNAAAEEACYTFVQGNIPWNYEGATSWSPTNVQNLCTGTTVAAEPGRCFDRVMTGGINWGGGTSWQWQNALDLCKGTSDANATVACFQGRIAAGDSWQTAIPFCNP